MNLADLQNCIVADDQLRRSIASGDKDAAASRAAHGVAERLSDWAVAQLLRGSRDSAIKGLEDALRLCPSSQAAFHNLLSMLLDQRQLRGPVLEQLRKHLVSLLRAKVPWAQHYVHLLWLPTFANVEFVLGKCNLRCRMCLSVQDSESKKLECVSAADFGRMFSSMPTLSALTLSSGDSDPLLHPELAEILEITHAHNLAVDIFTNGHALTEKLAQKLVDTQAVTTVNFSLDAATAETYQRIRGASFERVVKNMQRLRDYKLAKGAQLPRLSLSMVAMADNIEELPAFVDLAASMKAWRIYVEDLIGWDDRPSDNHLATDNPKWQEMVQIARERAAAAGLMLQLPERLAAKPAAAPASAPSPCAAPAAKHECCSWLSGAWVNRDGSIDPCCLIHRVADMGHVADGPAQNNPKFATVKSLLLSGKVFPGCANQRMCIYVQQQHAAGIPLRFITRQDLGNLAPPVVPLKVATEAA